MYLLVAVFVSLAAVTAGFPQSTEQKVSNISEVSNDTVSTYSWDSNAILQWFQTFFNKTQPGSSPMVLPEKCSCECGITNKNRRIVGGVETQVNQYPWMTMLLYRGRFYCGGTVINSRYVLTAAHCVDRFQKENMSIRILEHNRNSTSESQTRDYKVQQIIKHAGYSTTNFNNDIALLRIDGKFKFDKKFRPVCLPERSKTYSGEIGIVTGWGATEEGGPISTSLQEVMVPILSNAECRNTNYPSRKITDNMLCAGYIEGGKDSCQGDSGGPLHVMNNTIHSIVGIVSWGEGCAQPNYPGVYTRVNRFLSWIENSTRDACYC